DRVDRQEVGQILDPIPVRVLAQPPGELRHDPTAVAAEAHEQRRLELLRTEDAHDPSRRPLLARRAIRTSGPSRSPSGRRRQLQSRLRARPGGPAPTCSCGDPCAPAPPAGTAWCPTAPPPAR